MTTKLRLMLVALSIPGHVAAADVAAISHQIIGKWQWTSAASKCTETYDYRPDGSVSVASGDQELIGTYSVSEGQNTQGYYELRIEVSKVGGARRCPGNPLSSDASPHTAYVIFHRTQPLHLICETPGLDKCLGPLRRIYP